MNNQEIKMLGEEKISKLLLKFSIPCVMGLLISALYNIVDQIFIGNSELGYLGNAGTGINGILYAAPIADAVAAVVILCLTISFFRKIKKQR